MKAIVYTQYGPPEVLQLKEVEKPSPKENEVLVRVHAASGNELDWLRFASQSNVGRFMDSVVLKSVGAILGADLAGRVEAGGAEVKQFWAGGGGFGVAGGKKGGCAEF